MRNFHLRVIVDEINNLKNSIKKVSFFPVFRERTYTTNASSKLGVQMAPDNRAYLGTSSSADPGPFISLFSDIPQSYNLLQM